MSDFWKSIWRQFSHNYLGLLSLYIIALFCLLGIYAPLLASSKPLVVYFDGHWYFPLFHYLFFRGYYTKYLDLFYNLLMFTLPLCLIIWMTLKNKTTLFRLAMITIITTHIFLFLYFVFRPSVDPVANRAKAQRLQQELIEQKSNPQLSAKLPNWKNDLQEMTPYARLNTLLHYQQMKIQYQHLENYTKNLSSTLWSIHYQHEKDDESRQLNIISHYIQGNEYEIAKAQLAYHKEKNEWIEANIGQLQYEIMPFIRPFHWEDDAGGSQSLNRQISWWDITRTNRKDMVSALIFGIRISLSVGFIATAIALFIGIPIGALAGYYGGKLDMITYRLIEVWESMPTFFMLLMVVAILQSKSIFLVIAIIGLFGWTSFSRFIRGEFFRQKQLPYVEACKALGFNDSRIIFSHLLPNSIPPVLTLIPFTIMGAITSEAGLSFLGLGEEGSCSWGVLMDEGRSAFPSESYLLWPPAIMLTILLVSIALVGDALRDALDPQLYREID